MSHYRIITRKRNKLAITAAAGALTMTTATSAAAAVWPAGLSAGPVLTGTGRARAQAASAGPGSTQAYLASLQATLAGGHQDATLAGGHQDATLAGGHQDATFAGGQQVVTTMMPRALQRAEAAGEAVTAQAETLRQEAAPAAAGLGSARSAAQGMLGSFGWSAGQFSCLDPLWSAESRWSVTARNPSTGAYGIPQALPGSKMASAGPGWRTDAATQIRWGLGYIKRVYGSPCAAWRHERSYGWY